MFTQQFYCSPLIYLPSDPSELRSLEDQRTVIRELAATHQLAVSGR
ncbi:hypothetical protein ACPOL_4609 [Acidisarcina polymorpha]|uniref:Uncharacterized protein n=1 Tax=Acidisarcina polymorpha TaxID=2211140 RepID=A0A2Z5G478_9BACT|nr:hypothetical protein ACPOL_4609 [Acidisarcina polymorpha]